jgi:FAD/FMN-containing dehydrogenase
MSMTETELNRIGEATLAEFAAGLRGTVVRAGDQDYDRERRIWNRAHDRRPAVIVRCAGVADVIRTVDLARTEGLPLAVRGGGHSIPGSRPLTAASCWTCRR